MLTRRQFLQMGAIGGVAALLPWERALDAFAAGISTPQFAVPLTVPPVLAPSRTDSTTDYYNITMKTARLGILPGKLTTLWTYNGQFPGPTISARANRKVVVRQTNGLTVPTTVHLHGGHVAPADDGHPADLIQPGRFKDYNYPNAQLGATLWYHDHTMHFTSRNVYMGLAGLYILRDDVETGLNLPSGAYDVPVILQDRSFKADGSLAFSDSHSAELGNTVLANGRPWPFFAVAARKYRFRFLNASNSREYELSLDSGKPLQQIASDGGLLPAPFSTPSIRLSPAERAEWVYDFAQHPVGTKIVLENLKGTSADGTDTIMRFDVVRTEADTSKLPAALRPLTKLTGAALTRDFSLSFSRFAGTWLINGKSFDPNRVDVSPKLGATEIWRVGNSSPMAHPFHIHLVMFQVLDRDGKPPAKGEAGWKDTVRVDPGSTVRVIAKFTGYTGRYVYHCHNLAHEDHDMMAQMQIVP